MFKSVLIANRGEIACRISRTARRLGLRSIAIYSEADSHALHTRLCDETYNIGPPPVTQSYLAIEKLIAVAKTARAECIHPGYGFLSENADFAQACADAGIVFVGPPPQAIRAMGLKDHAKQLMEKAGVPVVPGYHGEIQEPKFLKQKAYEIGYPVLVKAVAGGGGKGMRRVDRHVDFDEALAAAQREAKASFGNARVLIEKYVAKPRHIEFQIFADRKGNTIHLGERDCSLQRRHQKVIEEAPAPGMNSDLRAAMGAAAVMAAKAVGYAGAGTVEFIADGARGLKAGGFWFIEMNTRLQVEHPVTEMITGLDLVEWQLRVAAGENLPLAQHLLKLDGHAVEARLYAEDPQHSFLPSTGRLLELQFPKEEHVRIDSGVERGSEVTSFYDPMIAKVIAHGKTRAEALERLGDALDRTVVAGPHSNAAFLAALCRAAAFRKGEFDTNFIDRNLSALGAVSRELDLSAVALGAENLLTQEQTRVALTREQELDEPVSPWESADAFQISGPRRLAMPVLAEGKPVVAEVFYGPQGASVTVAGVTAARDAMVIVGEDAVYVLRHSLQTKVSLRDLTLDEAGDQDKSGLVRAPMHGKVLGLLVQQGARVARGERIAIIEAMKMEHTLVAPIDGVVAEISVSLDAQISEGAKMMQIVPIQESNA